MSKNRVHKVMLAFLALVILISPILSPLQLYANEYEPDNPKTNALPQIMIPAPGGLQINSWNGNLFHHLPLLQLPGRGLSIDVALSYNSSWFNTGEQFGPGWQFNYNMYYTVLDDGDIAISWQDGRSQRFDFIDGNYVAPVDTHEVLEEYEAGKFKLTTLRGMTYTFADQGHKKLTQIEDPNGNRISLHYTGAALTSLIDPSGRIVSIDYNADGQVSQVIDANITPARTINFSYEDNKLTTITDPLGRSISYTYNEINFLTSITDQRGIKTGVQYHNGTPYHITHDSGISMYTTFDHANLQTQVIQISADGEHPVTTYKYDAGGRIEEIEQLKDGNGATIASHYVWDDENNLLSQTDALDRMTSYTYDDDGNVLTVADPQGNLSSYTYGNHNKITSVTNAQGVAYHYSYDTNGRLIETRNPLDEALLLTYDSFGQLSAVTDENGSTTSFTYDVYGNLIKTIDPLGNESQASFDGIGRLISATDPSGNSINSRYDLVGNLLEETNPLSHSTNFAYDEANQLVSVTDANGNETVTGYDQAGRAVIGTNALGHATQTRYDSLGRQTHVIDGNGNATRYEYNLLGQLICEIDPLGNKTSYRYDDVGNLSEKIDANGAVIAYTYDELDRLVLIEYPDERNTTYAYDEIGNLTRESNRSVMVEYQYDILGRMTAKRMMSSNLDKTLRYTYDGVGNRATMVDPDGGVTTYNYDGANRLTGLTNPLNETTTFVYDASGRMTTETLANGVVTSYSYDVASQLTLLEHRQADGTLISSYGYNYDPVGNRTQLVKDGTHIDTYTYDNVYQLTEVGYANGVVEKFVYDPVGNRLSHEKNGAVNDYIYNAGNEMLAAGGVTFGYDANGNMTSKTEGGQTKSYAFDFDNRMTGFEGGPTQVSYSYYPDGLMFERNGEGMLYDGSELLLKYDASGDVLERHTSAGVTNLISTAVNGNSHYFAQDGQLSIVEVIDQNGAFQSIEYDVFGNLTSSAPFQDFAVRYTGHFLDADLGEYYAKARFYLAGSGRFHTEDPLGYIDGLNTYLYTQNNPINLIDPSGEIAFATIAMIAVTGGALNALVSIGTDLLTGEDIDVHAATGAFVDGFIQTGVSVIAPGAGAWVGDVLGAVAGGLTEQALNGEFDHNALAKDVVSKIIPGPSKITGKLFGKIVKQSRPFKRSLAQTDERVFKMLSTKLFNGQINDLHEKGWRRVDRHLIRQFKPIQKIGKNVGEYYVDKLFYRNVDGITYVAKGTDGGDYSIQGIVEGEQVVWFADDSENSQGPNNLEQGELSSDPTNWTATFFTGTDLDPSKEVSSQPLDDDVDHLHFRDDGSGSIETLPVGPDDFSIRFERKIYFSEEGDWYFNIESDDGFRLFIDGEQKEYQWYESHIDIQDSNYLTAGYHDIVLEYFDAGGPGFLDFSWYRDYRADQGVYFCTHTGHRNDHKEDCQRMSGEIPSFRNTTIGNDTLKAITIIEADYGFETVVFEDDNFDGDWEHYGGNQPNLDSPQDHIDQDEASSAIVRSYHKNDPIFILYDLGDFNGESFKGDSDLLNLKYWDFNDRASSLRVKDGYQIIVCDHTNMRGACGRGSGDIQDIGALNSALRRSDKDRLSSLRVCEGSCPAGPNAAIQTLPHNGATYSSNTISFAWVGNGDYYEVEVWGGVLGNAIQKYSSDDASITVSDLFPSDEPYFWRVKGWNEFGEGSTGSTRTFSVELASGFGQHGTPPAADEVWDIGVFNPNDRDQFFFRYGNFDGSYSLGAQTSMWPDFISSDHDLQVFTGDFDGDGVTDVGFFNLIGRSEFYIYFMDGQGGLKEITRWNWGLSISAEHAEVYAGDFNCDGLHDVGLFNPNNHMTMYTRWGNGDGTFGNQASWDWPNPNNQAYHYDYFITGDFNGDCYWDISVRHPFGDSRFYHTRLNDGSGVNFGSATRFEWSGGTHRDDWVYSGDFNGDGLHDLGIFNPNGRSTFYVRHSDGTGDFTSQNSFGWPLSTQVDHRRTLIFTGQFNPPPAALISSVSIEGPTEAAPNTTFTLTAGTTPVTATSVTYEWVPEPINGQGSHVATYAGNAIGSMDVEVTASNHQGSANAHHTVSIACPEGSFAASYYNHTNLEGSPIQSECSSSIDYDWGHGGPQFGQDGNLVIPAGETAILPVFSYELTGSPAAGVKEISVASIPSDLEPNDLVMLLQTRGLIDVAGQYELNRIIAIDGNTIHLEEPLQHSYVNSNDSYNFTAQVVSIPEFNTVTVDGTLVAPAWNGDTGGILPMRVYGEVTIGESGIISMNGNGHLGGRTYRDEAGYDDAVTGEAGESWVLPSAPHRTFLRTTSGSVPSAIGLNNGGGGAGGQGRRGPDVGVGGAGASYGTQGYNGATTNGGMRWSHAGAPYGAPTLDRLFLGSGGGGGGRAKDKPAVGYCDGGNGGGLIFIEAHRITNSGTISSNGSNGKNSHNNCGSGGAGSGGTILVSLIDQFDGLENLSINGGLGGTAPSGIGRGGWAGKGRARVDALLANGVAPESTLVTNNGLLAFDHFSGRWEGIIPFEAGTTTFQIEAEGGVRLWVDNELIVDRWTPITHSVQAQFETTGFHAVKLEYFDTDGTASLQLSWSPQVEPELEDTTINNNCMISAQGENGAGEAASMIFDDNPHTKWLDFAMGHLSTRSSWVQCEYQNGATYTVTAYQLQAANDAPERDPADFRLQGSVDGLTWVTLDTQTGVVFDNRHETKNFTISNSTAYHGYRLIIDRVANPSGANSVQLAELELFGTLDDLVVEPFSEPAVLVDTTDSDNCIVIAQDENGDGEAALKLFDNNPHTKWLDFANSSPSTRSSWIQCEYQDGQPHVVTEYTLTTANDSPERDPANWRLLGSNDGGQSWMILDSRVDEQFSQRHESRSFEIANVAGYKLYRLVIDSVADPASANSVQLAEIELRGLAGEGDLDSAGEFTYLISHQFDRTSMNLLAGLPGSGYQPLRGDFDGNGADDIFFYASNGNAEKILWGETNGMTTLVSLPDLISTVYTPLVGDFDGDGATDIFFYKEGGMVEKMMWGTNDRGLITIDAPLQVGGVYQPLVGDFDASGTADIYWYAPGSTQEVMFWGESNRTFTGVTSTPVGGTYTPLVGDFDGSGSDDIYWYAPGSTSEAIFWGELNRTFTGVNTLNVGGIYTPLVGDFDGSGSDDIYWYAPGSTSEAIFWGELNRTFTGVNTLNVGGTYTTLVGDFDSDGAEDIYWYAPSSAAEAIFWGSASQAFNATNPSTTDAGYIPIQGDYDGNGTVDIYWHRLD